MPISDYDKTIFIDKSVQASGTPDIDAGNLNKIGDRLELLTEEMQDLQANYETASSLLTFLKTVDGPASGLDADTLDGTQLADIQIRSEKAAASGYASLNASTKIPVAQIDEALVQLKSERSVANGYASLGSDGKVPSAQLPASSSSVTSVFTRTGAVVSASGDYTATQVTNTPAGTIAATNVQTALNELDTEKQATSAKNAASGYAGLDGSTKLTLTQMATGTPTDKLFVRGDGTWAGSLYVCTSGTRPSSPHEGMPIYETDTDRVLINTGTSGSPVWWVVGTSWIVPFSDGRATITTGDIPIRYQADVNQTIIGVRANVYDPSDSGTVVGDLKRATSGTPGTLTSLYTSATKPTIASGAYGSGAAALPDTVAIPAGDWLVGNINAAGTSAGGFLLQVRVVATG